MFVTVTGSDGTLAELAYDIATSKGFRIPFDNVAMFGSHSHSGPGAITPEFLWAVVPATDLLVPGKRVLAGLVERCYNGLLIIRTAGNVCHINSKCHAPSTRKFAGWNDGHRYIS